MAQSCRRLRLSACLLFLLLLLPLSACGPSDREQESHCLRALIALEGPGTVARLTNRHATAGADGGVRVHLSYQRRDDAGTTPRVLSCRFAGRGYDRTRLVLTELLRQPGGPLSDMRRYFLVRFWLGDPQAGADEAARLDAALHPVSVPEIPARAAYLVQQALNAVALGSFYALLAVAYTLLYAVGRSIVLVFGELAMIGALAAFSGVAAVGAVTGLDSALVVGGAAAIGILAAVAHGEAVRRLVLQPVAARSPRTVLVASFAAALALSEYARLTEGADDRLLPSLTGAVITLARADGFAVVLSVVPLATTLGTVLLLLLLVPLLRRGRFALNWRAVAQDPGMAALCGVSPGRVWAQVFLLASGLAGAVGAMIMLRYGVANFHMGAMLGFKALAAAVIGGLGRPRGAVLGGVIVGTVETLWTAYLDMGWRDVAVFGLLAAVLVMRPQGLLGWPDAVEEGRRLGDRG